MLRSLTLLIPLASISLAGCTSDEPYDELSGDSQDDLAIDTKADGAPGSVYTYFAVKADLRKCAWPYCGGVFVDRLNRSRTVCPDGQPSDACYVSELDWSQSGLDRATQGELNAAARQDATWPGVHAIVRGYYGEPLYAEVPDLGRFVVTEAWVAPGEQASMGVFVKVADNGIRCFRAPCPSLTERKLNSSRHADISALDWSESGLSLEQRSDLQDELYSPDGLIIAGDRYWYEDIAEPAKGRTVSTAFRRLARDVSGE